MSSSIILKTQGFRISCPRYCRFRKNGSGQAEVLAAEGLWKLISGIVCCRLYSRKRRDCLQFLCVWYKTLHDKVDKKVSDE